jgi:hypothetical protein
MSTKLSDYFVYYPKIVNGNLVAVPPLDKALYDATEDLFFLVGRPSASKDAVGTTFNLKDR